MKRSQDLIKKRREFIIKRIWELNNSGFTIANAITKISQEELFCSERTIWYDLKEIVTAKTD